MSIELVQAIILVILLCFFIYLIIWTIGYFRTGLNKKRDLQNKESKKKIEDIRLRTIGCAKNYWYNKRDVEDCTDSKMKESLYHYFDDVDECITDLVVEMYDCALVRTEELSRIAYGESVFEDIKDTKTSNKNVAIEVSKEDIDLVESEDEITLEVSVEEKIEETVEENKDIETELQKKERVQKALEEDDNATSYKEELDMESYVGISEEEKRRKVAIKAAIYEHWVGYVFELYQLIDINADEDNKNRIRKELMHYGYNDIEVLMHSPDTI